MIHRFQRLLPARRAVGAVCHAVDRVYRGQIGMLLRCSPPDQCHGCLKMLRLVVFAFLTTLQCFTCGSTLQRVAILDFDVHHGNGTEEIINKYGEPSQLFFFSVHLYDRNKSYEFYPGTGKDDYLLRNIVNAPMKPLWRRDNGSSSSGRGKRQVYIARWGRQSLSSYFAKTIASTACLQVKPSFVLWL